MSFSNFHPNTVAALVVLGPTILLAALVCVGMFVDSVLTYRKAKSSCLLDAFARSYSPAAYPPAPRARS